VNFAVGGIAVGPDDKENVERTILPAHDLLLKTVLSFVLMCKFDALIGIMQISFDE
jgi:hypothetical protein